MLAILSLLFFNFAVHASDKITTHAIEPSQIHFFALLPTEIQNFIATYLERETDKEFIDRITSRKYRVFQIIHTSKNCHFNPYYCLCIPAPFKIFYSQNYKHTIAMQCFTTEQGLDTTQLSITKNLKDPNPPIEKKECQGETVFCAITNDGTTYALAQKERRSDHLVQYSIIINNKESRKIEKFIAYSLKLCAFNKQSTQLIARTKNEKNEFFNYIYPVANKATPSTLSQYFCNFGICKNLPASNN
ncbi:MAG TPA: hypothetical protein VEK38_00720 [Candidatus Bathyarchaeia archaeon]|nr:hypothetical protein [Candidatus Bathyarchaeia archaeon]